MMPIKHLLALAAVCGAPAGALAGPTAYAPNGLFTSVPGADDLIVFDVDHPEEFTTIGTMGVTNIGFGGMDFDADGNLYAYASYYHSTGGAASGLYRVDMDTGQATPIGNSIQSLDDIAFNPADGEMYGVRSQNFTARLYRINLATGQTSLVGTFQSDPPVGNALGLAFDSTGAVYVHTADNDTIYKGVGLQVEPLYVVPQDTTFSQGMTVDWSRNDKGYHAAVGQGEYPHYFAQVNTFAPDGSGYTLGPTFGPNIDGGDGFTYPQVQPGDIAIVPATGPEVCGPADLAAPFGQIDLFDLIEFLSLFEAQDDGADMDGNGVWDLFDVLGFVDAFSAGCP